MKSKSFAVEVTLDTFKNKESYQPTYFLERSLAVEVSEVATRPQMSKKAQKAEVIKNKGSAPSTLLNKNILYLEKNFLYVKIYLFNFFYFLKKYVRVRVAII